MTYNEYKDIISDAVTEYCKNGGSLLNIALSSSSKEYIYEFDHVVSEDIKHNMIDKAHQAMQNELDLPPGIRLVKVIFK